MIWPYVLVLLLLVTVQADSRDVASFIIGIKHNNVHNLKQAFDNVTDPTSPYFRKWLPENEVIDMIRPEIAVIQRMETFLRGHSLTFRTSAYKDMIHVMARMPKLEDVFQTTLTQTPEKRAPIGIHHFPPELQRHIAFVSLPTMDSRMAPSPSHSMEASGLNAEPHVQPGIIHLKTNGSSFNVQVVTWCPVYEGEQSYVKAGDTIDHPVCWYRNQTVKFVLDSVQDVWAIIPYSMAINNDTTFKPEWKRGSGALTWGYAGSSFSFQYPSTNYRIYQLVLNLTWKMVSGDAPGTYSTLSLTTDFPSMTQPTVMPGYLETYYKSRRIDPKEWHPANLQAVGNVDTGFPGTTGFYSRRDLEQFFQQNRVSPDLVSKVSFVPFNESDQVPPYDLKDADGEANLDIQWMAGSNPGCPTTIFHTPYLPDIFSGLMMAVQKAEKKPLVLSISYDIDEVIERKEHASEIDHVNELFMAFGSMGMSILVASGDRGAYGSHKKEETCNKFWPAFPASSPYVTSVGASQLMDVGSNGLEEVVSSVLSGSFITSGGGFSNLFDRPAWQSSQVEAYLRNSTCVDSDLRAFMPTNKRGFPDLAILGHDYGVVKGGKLSRMDGTSASAPALAALINRYNNIRLQKGLPSLGFLNPVLYDIHRKHPEAFKDIQHGNIRCLTKFCCPIGYEACSGWDPASGLGSPNFEVLGDLLSQN